MKVSLSVHVGGIGTEVHKQQTWGWVMYSVSKEEKLIHKRGHLA